MRSQSSLRRGAGRYLAVVLMAVVWCSSICQLGNSSAKSITTTSTLTTDEGRSEKAKSPARAPSLPEKSSDSAIRKENIQPPLSFERNEGQTDARVKFTSRGTGYSLFLTTAEAVLVLRDSAPRTKKLLSHKERSTLRSVNSAVLKMKLIGANDNPRITGLDQLTGKSNYFIGNDPAKWRTNVPNFGKVKFEDVYPGIDVIYHGTPQELEYDFIVSPGSDPQQIKLNFDGARQMHIDRRGDLVLATSAGKVRQHLPHVYQLIDGRRQQVFARYVITGERQAGFKVGTYDQTKPLVIDPVLTYSTFLGGTHHDYAYGVAVDSSGNAYVTGYTSSTNFPTENPFQPNRAGSSDFLQDAFVTKLSAAGSTLIYSTYIGGVDDENGTGIAIDSSGNAHITGYTRSSDFPTANALQASFGGSVYDSYVAVLNATGDALVYSTFLGGSGDDQAQDIAVDSSGNTYVTGFTDSTNFPTLNAYQSTFAGGGKDAFVTKLNATGSALVYSTYLGGSAGTGFGDEAFSIAVDTQGNAFIGGETSSSNFPTQNAYQSTYGGHQNDAFISKLSAAGNTLVYSTFLGGNGGESIDSLAVDSSGNAYVTGYTFSTTFPIANAFQSTLGGSYDAFVTKLNASGNGLVYSTYLRGAGNTNEFGMGIAVDSAGYAYVTGSTTSLNFPLASPLQSSKAGNNDIFVTKFGLTGNTLVFSTYLGGSGDEHGYDIAIDSSNNAYVVGYTSSSNFPTVNPYQPYSGCCNNDAIVFKISGLNVYGISGQITDLNGQGMNAVTVTLSGSQTGSVQTDATGQYSLSGLAPGGNYTVTPSKSPFTFVPTSRTFNNLSSDQIGNFTPLGYSVSGRVTNTGGTGLSDITLTLSGHQTGTVQTDANGNYSFPSVAAGGNYTITPSRPDPLITYSFNPINRSITNLNANTSLLDFTASIAIISTLNPIADAYVQDGSAANTNFGTATSMLVRTDNQTNNGLNRDTYLMFDLDGVNGSISSVKLRFYAALSQAGSVTTGAYSVGSTTWKESGSGSITWNNKPTKSNNPLPGATVVINTTAFATYDIDVTNYVRDEKLAGRNKVSLALHDPSPVTPHFTLNSREAATIKPRLIVTTSATSNLAPAISITNPQAGANFTVPGSLQISSTATDSDGSISSVSYYAGTQSIGSSTTGPTYQITWTPVPQGAYNLFAVAMDNNGATTTSNPINVNVNPANSAPTVSLESPLDGTIFAAGSNIGLSAKAADSDGSLNKVEFFAGATLVGTATTPGPDNLYSVTWNNVASGAYVLFAKATDNASGVTNSSQVNISVVSQTGLSPLFDAYVRDGSSASTNFGTANELQVQASATAGSNRESYLRFDLQSVSGIARAKLRLYGKLSDASGTNVPLGAYPVASTTWVESGNGSITWNNRPAVGNLLSSTTIKDNTARWYEFDVTSHVKNEKDVLNHNLVSLAVKSLANSSPYATFSSREATTVNDIRPQLIIWTTQARNALLVVGSSNLGLGDNAVKTRLQNLGFTVTIKVANNGLVSTDADGKTVVVISSTVTATSVNTKFRHAAVPIVNWEFDIFDDMAMTGSTDQGTTPSTQTQLTIINTTHPLAAGLSSGNQPVATTGTNFTWGNPNTNPNAVKIATVVGDANKFVIFGYDEGVAMPALLSPARRVGLFMTDLTANSFGTTNGGPLFDAAIKWASEVITKPVISSVSPSLGPTGTTVTITGINFGFTQGTSTLKFNGVTAAPTSWTDKSIVSSVPLYSATGPIVVTVSGVASNGVVFAVGEIDSDSDGLPDNWEIQYFGNLNQTASGDPDGDGISNLQEYQQGRNPTKSALADPGDFVNLKVHTPLSP